MSETFGQGTTATRNPISSVVQADHSDSSSETFAIQQTAGTSSGNPKSPHSHQHRHTNRQSDEGGLLMGIFGGLSSSSTSKKSDSRRVVDTKNDERPPANWDGVPYHNGSRSVNPSNLSPLRDPNTRSSASPRTASQPLREYKPETRTPVERSLPPVQIVQNKPPRAIPVPESMVPKPAPKTTTSTNTVVSKSSAPTAASTSNSMARIASSLSTKSSSRRSSDRQESSNSVTSAPSTSKGVIETTPRLPGDVAGPQVPRKEIPFNPNATAGKLSALSTLAAGTKSPSYSTPQSTSDLSATKEEEPLGSVPAVPYAASAPDPKAQQAEAESGGFQPRQSVTSNRTGSSAEINIFRPASSKPTADLNGPSASGEMASLRRQQLSAELLAPTRMTSTSTTDSISGTETTPTLDTLRSYTLNEPSQVPSLPVTAKQNLPDTTSTPPIGSTTTNNNLTNSPQESKPTPAATTAEAHIAGLPNESSRAVQAGQTTIASELPGIRVVTFGPSQITIRQSHPYEIRVENRGAIDAVNVVVRAHIPSWAEVQGTQASNGQVTSSAQTGESERLVWNIEKLPAGSVEKMFVRLKAVRSGSHDMDVDWTLAPQKSSATVFVQEPKIALAIDGPEEVIYGQTKTYKVRISNPGDGLAPNVLFTLSPNSATPQTQRIGDIPAGKEAQIEIELTAQDLVDLKINGLASGDLDLRAEATKSIRVSAARLEAIFSGPEIKYQNTESTYSLQLKNSGTATSENVVASLRLPSGVKFLGGIDNATQQADMLTWNIEALPPGSVRDYQFRCKMVTTGDQVFAFNVAGTAAGTADVQIATRVEAIADLVLSVNDPPAPAPVGSDVVYEITIRNRGSKAATDVTTVAQFSDGIEPQRLEGHTGKLIVGQALFEAIPRIAPGEEIDLRVIAKAEIDGHHRFRAEIRSADTVLVAEEATHFMSPQSERISARSGEQTSRAMSNSPTSTNAR